MGGTDETGGTAENEQQRMEQQRMEQQRMEQQRIEEQRRMEEQKQMSGMEMSQSFSQSTQSSTTIQQQSTSSHSTNEVYESMSMDVGIMKGYKRADEVDHASMGVQSIHDKFMKDNGIFGGITGDHNSLLEEDAQEIKAREEQM